MDTRQGWIYGLFNTEDPGKIRYVGQTRSRRGVSDRLYHHIYDAISLQRPYPVQRWIRKRGRDSISVIVLEEVSVPELDDREIHWITHYRALGQADLNLLSGGTGMPSDAMSGECNPKATLTWDIVRSLRVEAQSKYVSPRQVAALYGMTSAAISKVLLNQSWFDPEYDPSLRVGHEKAETPLWRALTDAEVEDVRQRYLSGVPITEIVRIYGVPRTTVTRCLFDLYGSEESRQACVVKRGPVRPRPPKISDSQKREAVSRYRAGESQGSIARDLGVTQGAISGWVTSGKLEGI